MKWDLIRSVSCSVCGLNYKPTARARKWIRNNPDEPKVCASCWKSAQVDSPSVDNNTIQEEDVSPPSCRVCNEDVGVVLVCLKCYNDLRPQKYEECTACKNECTNDVFFHAETKEVLCRWCFLNRIGGKWKSGF
ncbi:MAG: hypothetical protein ACXABY_33970 [Candidatus Thorarchaeota archaeon]|jgi:hypothetical protein